jgi:MFS transporter, PAT family, beta-lactamase induction signal transducer AmpG
MRAGILNKYTVSSAAFEPERRLPAELGAALRRRNTWLGLGIALTAGAAFEAVGAVAGPMLVDRGLDTGEVGTFLFLPAVIAMTAGSLAGGRATDRIGARRATAASVAIVAVLVLGLAAASRTSPAVLLVLFALVYVGIGLLTASSYALFMQLTHPSLAATEFSAFMGATNGCEAWAGYAVGRLQPRWGYGPAFAVMALASLLALPLLAAVRRNPVRTASAPDRR